MPVKYKDLSKAADDLFSKNYEHGKYSLEVNSKAEGFEFKTKGHQNLADASINSSHETTMSLCKFGKLKETFTPGKDNLAFDWEKQLLVKNTKFNVLFDLSLSGCPIPSVKNVKVNHTCDKVNLNLDSNLGQKISGDLTAELPKVPFVLGSKFAFDLSSMSVSNYELACAKSAGTMSYVMKTSLQNDLNCLIHNQLNDKMALATSITHNSKDTTLGIAAAIKGACGSSNQFKVSNNGRFAVSHITPTNFGAKLTVSGEFDAFNLSSGSHKIGAGLKFDL